MATFVNDRYVRLQATVPRYVAAIGGLKSATILIFKRTATSSAPAVPSVSATFDYSTGVLSGLNNSWSTNLPPVSDGAYLWGTLFYASASTGTVAVPSASWPAAQLMFDAAPAVAAQADATSALNNAALSTADIDAMKRDDILSPSEKPAENARWSAVVNEYSTIYTRGTTFGLTTQRDALGSAYTALNNYIAGLGTQFNTIPGVNISIVGSTYRSMFQGYYDARQTLLDKIYEITATKAVWATGITGRPTDAELLNSYIVVGGRNLYPDSGFERGTHPCTSRVGNGVVNPSATAASAYGISPYSDNKFLFLDGSLADMYVYLGGPLCLVKPGKQYVFSFMYATAGAVVVDAGNGSSSMLLLSNGTHVAVPHPVVVTGAVWTLCEFLWTCPAGVTTVEARFGIHTYGYSWMAVDCIQMEEGNKRTQWTPAPGDFIAEIDNIVNDNVLSRGEKPQFIQQWNSITAEASPLYNQGTSLGTIAERDAFNTKYTALLNYTYTMVDWDNVAVDTHIVGTTLRTRFVDYYTAKSNLQNAIAAKAAFAPSLVIGGRNLYSQTTNLNTFGDGASVPARSTTGFTLRGVAANNAVIRSYNSIPSNGTFTISFDLRVESTNGFPLTLDFCDANGWTINPTTVNQHFSFTFTVSNWTLATYNFIDFSGLSAQNYIFTNFKLESGNKETGWSPSPEDVTADAQARADAAANWATATAATYAQAQATLARTNAEAYADGIVTAEEQRAISDATSKANAAQAAAVAAAAANTAAKANLARGSNLFTGSLAAPFALTGASITDSAFADPYGTTNAIVVSIPANGAYAHYHFTGLATGFYTVKLKVRITNAHVPVVSTTNGATWEIGQWARGVTSSTSPVWVQVTLRQYTDTGMLDVLFGSFNGSSPQYTTPSPTAIGIADLDVVRDGYIGDLDASKGAPAGTNVAGVPAETVAGNAAAGAAVATTVNNPPGLTNVGAIDTYIASGGGLKTIETRTFGISGGTGPFTFSYIFEFGDQQGVTVGLYRSSSGGNTDNVLALKGNGYTAGSVTTGVLTVFGRDSKGFSATAAIPVRVESN